MRLVAAFVALGVAAVANLTAASSAVSADPSAYYCEYPKSVTVAGQTVTTPTICVPSP